MDKVLSEEDEERLIRKRFAQGDEGKIHELIKEFDITLHECMRILGKLYMEHPRFLAQDLTRGARLDRSFAYSNKCWYRYDSNGYWIADASQEIKIQAAAAWSLVGQRSKPFMVRDLMFFLESTLYVDPLMFDADPNLFGVGNGVINLETGELQPASPEMYLTKYTETNYRPGTRCPKFLKHLERLFLDQDPQSIDWIQRAIGSALVHGEQFYVQMVGPEGSGKGTFYHALQQALGNNTQAKSNVVVIAAENLVGKDQHSTWLTDLKGARLAFVDEIGPVSATLMNQLTGGDAITARRMRQDQVTFQPTHTLLCSSNERLQLRGNAGSKGLRRRYKLLTTGPTVPIKERKATWRVDVAFETEGILAWVIEGYKAWREKGLSDLPGMAEAAEEDVTAVDWREQWWEAVFIKWLPETSGKIMTNEQIYHNAKVWRSQANLGTLWTDLLAFEALAFVRNKGGVKGRGAKGVRGYRVKLREIELGDIVRSAV